LALNYGVDAVIRFGGGDYPDLFTEALFQEISTPLISPKLFEEMGGMVDESLFKRVPLIHDESLKFLDGGQWKTWLEAMHYKTINPDKGAHFNHFYFCCPHEALQKDKVLNFLAWLRDEASDQAEAIEAFMEDRVLLN